METQNHFNLHVYFSHFHSSLLHFLPIGMWNLLRRNAGRQKENRKWNCWKCCLLLRILKVYRNEWSSGYIQYTSRGLNIQSTEFSFFLFSFLLLLLLFFFFFRLVPLATPSSFVSIRPLRLTATQCAFVCVRLGQIHTQGSLPLLVLDMCRFCINVYYMCVCVCVWVCIAGL